MSSNLLAVSSLFIAATLWGVVWYPLRLLETAGMPGLWSILLTYSAAAILGLAAFSKIWSEIKQHTLLLSIVALGVAWCNVAFILAILDGNVLRIMLLFYLSPVWTTLLGWWLLQERLTLTEWGTLLLALIGALFMLWDSELGIPWPRDNADWLSLSAGFAFSVSNIAIRKLQHVSVTTKSVCSWWAISVLVAFYFLVTNSSLPEIDTSTFMWTTLIGMVVVVLMTVTVQYGVSNLPVYRSAVIMLFELVVGAISSLWLTDEIVTKMEWVGAALIITAAYVSASSMFSRKPVG